ncbi:GAP family protein [Mycobacterium sp. M26]|uniref:GAP family protein n=1 Tax=Mycobacterium sp. M26 TaxID=1762962 RepID=UPI00073E7444|nr:GAP family protein [Mycobacterium sp. M26]
MWTTVLVLAIAVNFEPTRIGLIALMLTRRHPIRQLLIFLLSGFTLSASVGLLVLFVFHRGLFGPTNFDGSKIQIGIGVAVLLIAAILASNVPLGRFARNPLAPPDPAEDDGSADATATTTTGRVAIRAKNIIHGESHWFSSFAGLGLAMPGVEYMALLALIIASNEPPAIQGLALFVFLFLANAISAIPLVSYLIAPQRTAAWVQSFNAWIRARTRRQVSLVLGLVGAILLIAGIVSL